MLILFAPCRCRGVGIGNALAREFHAQGFRVFATARSASQLEDLTALGIEAITLDVTSREQIAAAATEVASLTGGTLDILVNNAGKSCTIPALDATDEDMKGVFETNFFSVVYVCQGFAPLVIKAKGTIVQIGSITQMVPLTFGCEFFLGFLSAAQPDEKKNSTIQRNQSCFACIHGHSPR